MATQYKLLRVWLCFFGGTALFNLYKGLQVNVQQAIIVKQLRSKVMQSPLLVQVGRTQKYLEGVDKNLLPVSCTICVPDWTKDFRLATEYLIEFAIESLRAGVGINVHLDYFEGYYSKLLFINPPIFVISPQHKDARYFKYQLNLQPDPEVLVVEDSLSGKNGIIDCLKQLVADLLSVQPKFQYVDLSKLRANGTVNDSGMVASGPASFRNIFEAVVQFVHIPSIESLLAMISSFNQEIRRGGTFKNGAITTSLPYYHPDFVTYCTIDKGLHPWVKKAVSVTADFVENDDAMYLIEEGINDGSLWIEKILTNTGHYLETKEQALQFPEFARIRHNVCREILITDRQTCTLLHVNMGQCFRPDLLETALVQGMVSIIEIHQLNAPGRHPSGMYYNAEDDMQVGLGLVGMANFLTLNRFSYKEWTYMLAQYVFSLRDAIRHMCIWPESIPNIALEIAELSPTAPLRELIKANPRMALFMNAFINGYIRAARLAYSRGYKRAFTVAPTASSSFRHTDFRGYTLAPNIMPPIARKVERLSQTVEDGGKVYDYGQVETAGEVGFEVYTYLVDSLQRLFNATELAHSISFDILEDVDEEWLKGWNNSAIRATYYRTAIESDFLDKSDIARLAAPKGGAIQCDCAG